MDALKLVVKGAIKIGLADFVANTPSANPDDFKKQVAMIYKYTELRIDGQLQPIQAPVPSEVFEYIAAIVEIGTRIKTDGRVTEKQIYRLSRATVNNHICPLLKCIDFIHESLQAQFKSESAVLQSKSKRRTNAPLGVGATIDGACPLANEGATCYMNVVIQLLHQLPQMRRILAQIESRPDNTTRKEWPAFAAWTELYKKMECTTTPISAGVFLQEVYLLSSAQHEQIGQNVSGDSNEAMRFLIDTFHEAVRHKSDATVYSIARQKFTFYASPFTDIMGGYEIKRIVSATTNKIITQRLELFTQLILPIVGNSLVSCLDAHVMGETVIDDYHNDQTNCREKVTDNMRFYELPDILNVALQRIDNFGRKIDTELSVPIAGLDMGKYMDVRKAGVSYVYNLHGCIEHVGSGQGQLGGHYLAFVRNKCDGEFYRFDDASVTKVDVVPDAMASRYTYGMVYVRRTGTGKAYGQGGPLAP